MQNNLDIELEYENIGYSCDDLKEFVSRQKDNFVYKKVHDLILNYLKDKYKNSNLETLDISINMTLKQIHSHYYKITIFDTIETIRNLLKKIFVILTNYYYKKCGFDKKEEKDYYEHLIHEFINAETIREIIKNVVLKLVKERQLESGIELELYIELLIAKKYENHKSEKIPIVSSDIYIKNAYKFIKENYIKSGELNRAILSLLEEVVSALSREDTKKIIDEIKLNYNEYKIQFSDWLSFTCALNQIYFDLDYILKIMKKGAKNTIYKEVSDFLEDKYFFKKVFEKIVLDNEVMKILNNSYINMIKKIFDRSTGIYGGKYADFINLEIKDKKNEEAKKNGKEELELLFIKIDKNK